MRIIIIILMVFTSSILTACSSNWGNIDGKWQLKCIKDELTGVVKIVGRSPEADVVKSPGFPYGNVDTRLYINIFPNGSLNVAIWADRINLVGGKYHNEHEDYYLIGKFSPLDKLETYSVSYERESERFLWFKREKRTYTLILNNESLLLELPYFTGKGRYRYEWNKGDFANQVSALKKTCFGKK